MLGSVDFLYVFTPYFRAEFFVYLCYIAVTSDLLQLKIQALKIPADNLLRICDCSSLLV